MHSEGSGKTGQLCSEGSDETGQMCTVKALMRLGRCIQSQEPSLFVCDKNTFHMGWLVMNVLPLTTRCDCTCICIFKHTVWTLDRKIVNCSYVGLVLEGYLHQMPRYFTPNHL